MIIKWWVEKEREPVTILATEINPLKLPLLWTSAELWSATLHQQLLTSADSLDILFPSAQSSSCKAYEQKDPVKWLSHSYSLQIPHYIMNVRTALILRPFYHLWMGLHMQALSGRD